MKKRSQAVLILIQPLYTVQVLPTSIYFWIFAVKKDELQVIVIKFPPLLTSQSILSGFHPLSSEPFDSQLGLVNSIESTA